MDEGQPFALVVDYAHTDDALRNTIRTARELAPNRVITLFVPDRFAESFTPEPWDRARAQALGDGAFAGLMARGPLTTGSAAFMLPALSRT